MRQYFAALCAGALLLGGCKAGGSNPTANHPGARLERPPAETSADPVVAYVGSGQIRQSELIAPLIEAHGLRVLQNLMRLKMIEQEASKTGIVVTPADIDHERQITVDLLYKQTDTKLQDELDDAVAHKEEAKAAQLRKELQETKENILTLFLKNQGLSEPEFDIAMKSQAYLRKIVMPHLQGKITEETLQKAWRIEYGEKVIVQDIQCANPQEITQARALLAKGEGFGEVARKLSRNLRTRGLDGELPPFSRETPSLPQAFKTIAFSLKPGEISDTVYADGAYHIIKCKSFIAPRAVKFEDVKESLRSELHDRMVTAAMSELGQRLGQSALRTLKIENPVLKKQFAEQLSKQMGQIKERDKIKADLEQQRRTLATQPSQLPASVPTTIPAVSTIPAGAATASGAATSSSRPAK